ncbi:MAG: endopeptidase La [Muribaculaceae bacterium]|nr:endopeptidase La [Muribaculaceae bacterium]
MNYDGGNIFATGNTPKAFDEDGLGVDKIMFMPLEDEVFYPYMTLHTIITHPDSIATARQAKRKNEPLFFFLAGDMMPEESSNTRKEDIMYSRGSIGRINDLQDNPDGSITVLATMWHRAIAVNLSRRVPYMRGDVIIAPPFRLIHNKENQDLLSHVSALYMELADYLNPDDRKQFEAMSKGLNRESIKWINFMMQNSPLDTDTRYMLLEAVELSDQLNQLAVKFTNAFQELKIKREIAQKTANEMSMRQRDEILRNQLHAIRQELGEEAEDDFVELRERADSKQWNEETRKRFDKELKKLQRYNPATADYSVQYSFLDTYLDLPWNHCDNSSFELSDVKRILDRDHYGLEKVKERIVEQMAVLKLRCDTKAPILCLYGPPGVGKTSLGKSVAEALGRKYVRVALGGLHDEAEIRGHRRTYLGSMPGRILNALIKSGTSDPVMVLDEIDKLGADFKGDPSQALLEVLDPEQNCKFHDNYIDQDYDLSKVLFIATANSLATISQPLLDRMELLEVSGYIEQEKVEIAKNHLIPKCLEAHGFDKKEVQFSEDALQYIIHNYTRESGVRNLEKKINKILRKLAVKKASQQEFEQTIDSDIAGAYLGKPEIQSDVYEGNEITGVVTGLAWTAVGGEILYIETSVAPGKENKLTLTGNLGDVMKESAVIALQYIKANHEALGIPAEKLEFGNMHVHVPEGAVPKDGPSAGITIVTSIASTLTGRKVRRGLAMTGEITLRGKILPVGGIKEKILAAKRAGISTVMLSEKNRPDIEDIKAEYLEGLDFHFVESIGEALDFALLPE